MSSIERFHSILPLNVECVVIYTYSPFIHYTDVSSYHSNSSCDSDTLQQESYHGNANTTKHVDIPVHVNESISISDMDRDTTDIEVRTPP